MEHYKFKFETDNFGKKHKPYSVVGVVASGNLEVLVESNNTENETVFDIKTSAEGYQGTWKAVVNDIVSEHKTGGLNFFINDGGAVPAVVSLRLKQALEEIDSN